MWTYKGVDIFPADRNSSGIRWYARVTFGPIAMLRADTKDGMRELINRYRATGQARTKRLPRLGNTPAQRQSREAAATSSLYTVYRGPEGWLIRGASGHTYRPRGWTASGLPGPRHFLTRGDAEREVRLLERGDSGHSRTKSRAARRAGRR